MPENVIWLPRSSMTLPKFFDLEVRDDSIACFNELMIFFFSVR
jgi:hypothetical protein